jgi:hypothetical protein
MRGRYPVKLRKRALDGAAKCAAYWIVFLSSDLLGTIKKIVLTLGAPPNSPASHISSTGAGSPSVRRTMRHGFALFTNMVASLALMLGFIGLCSVRAS